MISAGTRVTSESRSSRNPRILFTFRDGALSTSGAGRITNKVVIRSIAGGRIVEPGSLPLESSVVKDYNQRATSPDGIYWSRGARPAHMGHLSWSGRDTS